MRTFLICAAATAVLPAVRSRPLAAEQCDRGTLVLEAGQVRTLPPSFGIQGTIVGSGGRVALWSAAGELLQSVAGDSIVSTQFSERLAIAGLAFGPTPGAWRVADAWTSRELLFAADGTRFGERSLALTRGQILEQAIWREGGWLLASRDLVARRFVVTRETIAGPVPLFRSAAADSVEGISSYRMTLEPAHLLLTETHAPFAVIRIDLVTGRADTLITPSLPISADSVTLWRALPALALDCGTLLSIASLTGDARLLVRWDAADRLVKVTRLDAPFGLVARLPEGHSLLAARRAGGLELVTYRWHWTADPPSSLTPDTRSSR